MADLLESMRRNPQGNWTINDVERLCAQNGVTCAAPRGKRPIKPVYIRALVGFISIVREQP